MTRLQTSDPCHGEPRIEHRGMAILLMLALAGAMGTPSSAEAPLHGMPSARPDSSRGFMQMEPPPPIAELPESAAIEALRTEMSRWRLEIRAMEEDAESALGEDAEALRANALESRLASVERFEQFVDLVLALDDKSLASTYYRNQLAEVLPRLGESVHIVHDLVNADLRKLMAERSGADAGLQASLDQDIRRQEERLGSILEVGAEQIEMVEGVQRDVSAERTWMADRLYARARLASARMHLRSIELSDAMELADASGADAALLMRVSEAGKRLEASNAMLAETVDLLVRLDLDATTYKKLLITSTGEITTDVFEQGVARQLIGGWVAGLRESVVDGAPSAVFRSLVFALIIVGSWMVSRFVRKVIERAVASPNLPLSQLVRRMIVSASVWGVLMLGLLVALSQLGFQIGPMLAGFGIAGFVLGFALQDTLANFAAGIMILLYRPYDVGDLIDCAAGVFGTVDKMSLVSTTVLTLDNRTLIVPNGKIWGDVITNVTAQRIRRVDLVFGISYGDDIPLAESVLWSVVKEHPKVLSDPEAIVKVHELGDSSVNFVVRPWVLRDDYWDVHWDFHREVKMRFDREGISIPFPQQDVHVHQVHDDPPQEPSLARESKATASARSALSAQGPTESD